jgi:hypothetical protein
VAPSRIVATLTIDRDDVIGGAEWTASTATRVAERMNSLFALRQHAGAPTSRAETTCRRPANNLIVHIT